MVQGVELTAYRPSSLSYTANLGGEMTGDSSHMMETGLCPKPAGIWRSTNVGRDQGLQSPLPGPGPAQIMDLDQEHSARLLHLPTKLKVKISKIGIGEHAVHLAFLVRCSHLRRCVPKVLSLLDLKLDISAV